jgi:acyl carrier protein
MQQEILDAINDFLREKGKGSVTLGDKLHSSGLLSSIDMFELILSFEQRAWRIPRGNDLNIQIEKIDSVSYLCEAVERK